MSLRDLVENQRSRIEDMENTTKKEEENKREEQIDKLLEECQGFKYTQSSNFSTLSRSIIFGIIGTLWIISYGDGEFTFPNRCSLYAMCAAFVYLIVDLIHYYWDSCFYKKEYVQFDKEKMSEIWAINELKKNNVVNQTGMPEKNSAVKNNASNPIFKGNSAQNSSDVKISKPKMVSDNPILASWLQAIVNDPKLLLCDEPTGNLDPEKSMEIMKVLEDINKNRGTTIIMATHDKEIVNKMKKQVIY